MTKHEKTEITWKCDACGVVVDYRPSWVTVKIRGGNADVEIAVTSERDSLIVLRILRPGDYCSRKCLRTSMTRAVEDLGDHERLSGVPEVPA